MLSGRVRERLQSGWLGLLDARLADAILENGRLLRIDDGLTIYGFGQVQECLYGIVSGAVQMWVTMNEQEPRFGHVAGPGFWFGETELVTGRAGIIHMVATDGIELFTLNRLAIERIAAVRDDMWRAIALLSVLNQNTAIGVADDLIIRDSKKRLAALLLRLASRRNAYQGVPPLNAIPVSWAELSEAAGLSRSTVGAILSEFSTRGLVRTRHRAIEILQSDGLQAVLKD